MRKTLRILSSLLFLASLAPAQTKLSFPQLPSLPVSSIWYASETGKLVPLKLGPFISVAKGSDGTYTLNITVTLSTVPRTFTFFATSGQRIFTLPNDADLSKAIVFRNGILQNMESGVLTLPDYSVSNSTHQITFTDGVAIQPDDIIKVII
jgi:hypothetical protein